MPDEPGRFKTNKKENSLLVVDGEVLTFNTLWSNYPDENVLHKDPKTGDDQFTDHCSINLSEALYTSGIRLKSFSGGRCWQCPTPNKNGQGRHALRAQELADYLLKRPFGGCPAPQKLIGKDFEKNISGKTGIVFFKDYWRRKGESGWTGDHIDLWDENELASIGYVVTLVRLIFSRFSENRLRMSDLKRSSLVLFWEIK